MEQSCNTTFAQLADELGAEEMREQAEAFGFNQHYLDDLPPQAELELPRRTSTPPQTGQSGIGQFEVPATPLQMAMVAAGIANGGTVMRPYLVDEVSRPTSTCSTRPSPRSSPEAVLRVDGRASSPS